jgi:hypothetical protein
MILWTINDNIVIKVMNTAPSTPYTHTENKQHMSVKVSLKLHLYGDIKTTFTIRITSSGHISELKLGH